MRWWRSALAVVATSVTVSALIVVGFLVSGSAAHRPPAVRPVVTAGAVAPAVVPWAALPPSPPPWHPTPTASPAPPPAVSPPCAAAVLRARFGPRNGATGHWLIPLTITNIGGRTCRLSGAPPVVATSPGMPPVVADHHVFLPDNGWGGDLAPGRSARLDMDTTAACIRYPAGNAPMARWRIAVTAPGGGVVTVSSPPLPLACGLHSGRFIVAERPDNVQNPPTYPWQDLRASLHAPIAVAPGSVLHFTLSLENVSNHSIALEPCPAYAVAVPGALYRHELNCAAVPGHAVAGGSTVTFAMQAAIPARAPLGPASVKWDAGWAGSAIIGQAAETPLTIARNPASVPSPAPPYRCRRRPRHTWRNMAACRVLSHMPCRAGLPVSLTCSGDSNSRSRARSGTVFRCRRASPTR